MKARIIFSLLLCIMPFSLTLGQNSEYSRSTLADIESVTIFVEPLSEALEAKGMTHEVLAAHVERSLRQAGIPVVAADDPSAASTPVLYVGVTAILDEAPVRCSYSVRVELMQPVRVERLPHIEPAIMSTWSVGGLGVGMTGWRQVLIDDVVAYTEQFIAAYREINPADGQP